MAETEKNKATLLIVDDTIGNIDILLHTLASDYDVRVATSGELALEAVEVIMPDLILLDVMMPGINGYQVCQTLKKSEKYKDIPIIFLTALTDEREEDKGFSLGAVDYITKPFKPQVVKKRVQNHLELSFARRELKEYSGKLEVLVEQKTAELQLVNKQLENANAIKSEFLSAISHELRTPVNSIVGTSYLALEAVPNAESRKELTETFNLATRRLMETIDASVLLADIKSGHCDIPIESVSVREVIEAAAHKAKTYLPDRQVVEVRNIPDNLHYKGSRPHLEQALTSLIRMIVKLANSRCPVEIHVEEHLSHFTTRLISQGKQVSDKLKDTIFDVFSFERASSYAEDLGLSIPLAGHIVEAFGGKIGVENISDGLKLELVFAKDSIA